MLSETPQLKKKQPKSSSPTVPHAPPRYFLKQLDLSLPDMTVKVLLHSFGAGEIKGT